jgi:glycosyltransferase involved in cell wall biosynthesis
VFLAVQMTTEKIRFTVFTPTYNRADTLHRAYESLVHQTFHDFEWLIVDDGSTDGTGELVERWQQEASFPIRYIWQANAHKKVAFNRGVREALGSFFLNLDSDDALTHDALEILYREWLSIPEDLREGFVGVCGLCINTDKKVIGNEFPQDPLDSNITEVFYKYRIRGDKCGFNRTDVLRLYSFPEDVKGHVPEGLIWSSIAEKYQLRYINKIILRVYLDTSNSLTRSRDFLSIKQNAEGSALWMSAVLSNELHWFFKSPLWFLRMSANYTRFHNHMRASGNRKKYFVKGWGGKCLVMLMQPVGYLLYYRDLWRK